MKFQIMVGLSLVAVLSMTVSAGSLKQNMKLSAMNRLNSPSKQVPAL